eukprot:3260181-Prymnesium_polylepis.1
MFDGTRHLEPDTVEEEMQMGLSSQALDTRDADSAQGRAGPRLQCTEHTAQGRTLGRDSRPESRGCAGGGGASRSAHPHPSSAVRDTTTQACTVLLLT